MFGSVYRKYFRVWQRVGGVLTAGEGRGASVEHVLPNTTHCHEMVVVDSFFSKTCHELTTAVCNWNDDITVHALEKNKQAAMPMSRTDQRGQWLFFQLQKNLQTLLKRWMPLPCIPMLSTSLQWCQRSITLEFNKTICYSVKIKLWFFVLRR